MRNGCSCLAALGFAALLLNACVVTDKPVGERPLALASSDWDGLWRFEREDETYRIEVVDPQAGKAKLTQLRRSGPSSKSDVMEVTMMAGGGGQFANIVSPEGLTWFRVERLGDRIIAHAPSPERFKEEVEKGRLVGKMERNILRLEGVPSGELRYLASDKALSLYLSDAMTLDRVASAKADAAPGWEGSRDYFNAMTGSQVFFDSGKSELSPEAETRLDRQIAWLRKNRAFDITLEGHADRLQTPEIALSLGERRAQAVENYMIRNGIERRRVKVVSYGRERPVDPGENENAWSKNRRVTTILWPKNP